MGMLGETGRRLRRLLRVSTVDRELDEISTNAWGWRWLEQLTQDARVGTRIFARNPSFTVTVVLTLALGIGATTAIFTLVNGVLLRPLPFADPERLVQVYGTNPLFGDSQRIGFNDLGAFRRESTAFESFVAFARTSKHLQDAASIDRVTAVSTERNFFDLLGVAPIVGRTFRRDDPPRVTVLSGTFWKRRFGGDAALMGRSIVLDGESFTVLGVMPETFQFPYAAASGLPGALTESRTDLWLLLPEVWRGRTDVTGRLKPGVGVEAAMGELAAVAKRLEATYPDTNRGIGVRLMPLRESVVGSVSRPLWVLFGAVGLVLAIACANVANLLLVSTTTRSREVAVRAALGAGRSRVVRQFLTESLLLSLAGGLIGLGVARLGVRLLLVLASARIPRAYELGMDWRAFGFLLSVCIAAAVLVGLVPALTAGSANIQGALSESGGRGTSGTGRRRMRDSLVVAELALAFVLALGAGVLVREFMRLQQTETGMVTQNVLTFHLTPRAPERDYYAIEERVAQLPGVLGAGFTQLVPLQNWGWMASFTIRGRPADDRSTKPTAELRYVTPKYFQVLGIPIRKGRGLTERDGPDAPRVILINEALARRYFPSEDPIGRVTDRGTIVGIVGDVRQVGLDQPAIPEIYYCISQNAAQTSDLGMSLIVRTQGRPEAVIDAVRSAISEVNRTQAIFNIRTMEQVMSESLSERNLYRWLIGLFAALALVLAAIGIYGVTSYTATSRTREFAIRLALGSDRIGLVRLVLGQGVRLAALGLALGACVALVLTRPLRNLPIGAGVDPATAGAIAALLFAIALLACVLPAIRVASVNPVTALRHD